MLTAPANGGDDDDTPESRRRPAVADFGCGEERITKKQDEDEDDDDGGAGIGTVLFCCHLPPPPPPPPEDNQTTTRRDTTISSSLETETNDSSSSAVAQPQQPPQQPLLPQRRRRRLTFRCRAPSCGALHPHEIVEIRPRACGGAAIDDERQDNDDDDYDADIDDDAAATAVDPHFFDAHYTLAAATGFQVWTGTRFLLEALCWPQKTNGDHDYDGDCERLQYWQQRLLVHIGDSSDENDNKQRPLRILELGAGIGVVGTYLAATASASATTQPVEVLLTDLPPLVRSSLAPNLRRNAADAAAGTNNNHNKNNHANSNEQPPPPPLWLCSEEEDENATAVAVVRVAPHGWAAAAALDWHRPAAEQLTRRQMNQVDLIVASDCVFLVDMLESLLDTVAELFEAAAAQQANSSNNCNNQAPPPSLLLSFQRRDSADGDAGPTFTTLNRVRTEVVRNRGWTMECLAWRPVTVPGPGTTADGEPQVTTEVFLYEIRAPCL